MIFKMLAATPQNSFVAISKGTKFNWGKMETQPLFQMTQMHVTHRAGLEVLFFAASLTGDAVPAN
jgi:hypothetical protein